MRVQVWRVLFAGLLTACSTSRQSRSVDRYSYLRTPFLSTVAWPPHGRGIVYSRRDLLGVGIGDVFSDVCDSSGLYVTDGKTPGRRWHSGPVLCAILANAGVVALAPDTMDLMYASQGGGGGLQRYHLDSGVQSVVLGTCIDVGTVPAWSPTGREIAVAAPCAGTPGASRIHLAHADGTNLRPAAGARSTVPEKSPSWSPDGRLIAVTEGERLASDSIAVINLLEATLTTLASGYDPVWNPTGSQIAYYHVESSPQASPTVRVMRPDGSGNRLLFDTFTAVGQAGKREYPSGPLLWSPDGDRLAIAFGQSLWEIDVQSGAARRVFTIPSWRY
jgi:Tol biopolymer transport system component